MKPDTQQVINSLLQELANKTLIIANLNSVIEQYQQKEKEKGE